MRIKMTFTAIALSLATSTAAFANDAVEQKLIDDGFMPAPINATTVVQREPVTPDSVGMAMAVDVALTPAETRTVKTMALKKNGPAPELTPTEKALAKDGLLATPLGYTTVEVDGDGKADEHLAQSR